MAVAASPSIDTPVRRRGARAALLSVAIVGFTYVLIGFILLDPDTLYSGDIGVQYVQSKSMAAHRFRHSWLPYPGEFIDGTKQYFPFLPPFTFRSHGQREAIFPPVRALVTAPFAAAGGIAGMVVLSVASAIAVLWLTWAIAGGPWRAAVPLVFGLGTWFWFYAVVPFAHTPALACAMAAMWLACCSRGPRRAALAGALFALGGLVRDESLLLLPGLLFAFWHRERSIRPSLTAAASMLAVLAVASAAEVWIYERPLASHPRHAVSALRTVLNFSGSADAAVPALPPLSLYQRYDVIVHQWIAGMASDAYIAAFVAILLLALAIHRWTGSAVGILVAALVAVYTAVQDARALIPLPRFIGGLYHLSPFLVFAALPPVRPRAAPGGISRLVAGVAIAGFLSIAFVVVDSPAGKALGPRILLPILPLATVVAWQTIAGYITDGSSGLHRAIGGAGLALVALSAAIHLGATIPALVQRNREERQAIAWIREAPEQVVVADEEITAQLVSPLYFSKVILLAESPGRAAMLARTLDAARVKSVLVVSRADPGSVALEPYARVSARTAGRFSVQRWSR